MSARSRIDPETGGFILFESNEAVERMVMFGTEALEILSRITKFHDLTRTDEVLQALLFTHNNLNDNTPGGADWERLGKAHKKLIEKRFLRRALQWLFDTEAISEKDAAAYPQSVAATVRLKESPFHFLETRQVKDSGTLYFLICTAQHIAVKFGCTLETAIEACMSTRLPEDHNKPDQNTAKALSHAFRNYDLVLVSQSIRQRVPKPSPDSNNSYGPPEPPELFTLKIGNLYDDTIEPDWDVIKKRLQSEVFARYAEKRRSQSPSDTTTTNFFPTCCRTTSECRTALTNAATAAARAFIDLQPSEEGQGGTIAWHQQPKNLFFHLAFELNLLKLEPLGQSETRNDAR